jgi:DNA-binding response OmpR family regulator
MATAAPRGVRVLIVDDERTVRDVARAAFEIAGFSVEAAESGEQALDEFRREPDRFALVVLDLTLPGISGRRVFHELRATRPGIPILLTSGFSAEEAVDLVAQPRAGFVPKPWRPQELVQQAQSLMSDRPRTP